jgi:hypothetical protein
MQAIVILSFLLQIATPNPVPVCGLPLMGAPSEEFLKSAKVVSVKEFDKLAITRPLKVELTDGHLTCYAVFKTIDQVAVKMKFSDGRTELRFSDRYRYEIAAYELDKLIGLGIVPPTVKRQIGRETGSLSLWVENSMTEWERLKVRDLHPPDLEMWNNQIHTIRLFQQLIWDTDYRNISNLLVTADWKIYKIDSSRAFRTHDTLRREESLRRFSRSLLERLRELSRKELKARLGRWLSKEQIEALWARRGLILELADRRIAEFGEDAVLFD